MKTFLTCAKAASPPSCRDAQTAYLRGRNPSQCLKIEMTVLAYCVELDPLDNLDKATGGAGWGKGQNDDYFLNHNQVCSKDRS